MKTKVKFIAVLVILLAILLGGVQGQRRKHLREVYTYVETLKIEASSIPRGDKENILIELPRKTNLILAYNDDRSKAIILYSPGYQFIRHMEYLVKDTESRLVLYYKDQYLYCGYVYDKKVKTALYFEAINEAEKERLARKVPFLNRIPSFTDD